MFTQGTVMRWTSPAPPSPNCIRKIDRFLWKPMTLYNKDGTTETRWLEMVRIEQYCAEGVYIDGKFVPTLWVNIRFLEIPPVYVH